MILALDIGNTQTVIGVFRGKTLAASWRMVTDRLRTTDECGIMVKSFFSDRALDPGDVEAAVVSSVVPPVTPVFEEMCRKFFKISPMIVGPGVRTGLDIQYENPREVGADRIVNAVAGVALYGAPLIIVDMGTATKFEAVSGNREYLGGAITPGLGISAEALFMRAAKLPRIELVKPPAAIGRNTVWSMQSGLIYGYIGLVEGLIHRIRAEMGGDPKVIATGGLASLIAGECRLVTHINPNLTLEGLRILYEMNRP